MTFGRWLKGLVLSGAVLLAADAVLADVTGRWKSSQGLFGSFVITLRQGGNQVSGSYTLDDGRISGTISGTTFRGIWSEKSSLEKCPDARLGSNYWGRVELRFDPEFRRFSGVWGYCGDQPGRSWSGTRIGGQPVSKPSAACVTYARLAVRLNQENLTARCRYRGGGWHSNYNIHLNWCQGAEQSSSAAAARARQSALQRCKTRHASPGAPVVRPKPAPAPSTLP